MKHLLIFLFFLTSATTALAQSEGTGGISTCANINKIKKFYEWQSVGYGPPQYYQILLSGYGSGTSGPGLIYRDGLVWGGLVRDGETPVKRAGGKTHVMGEIPGWIENGEPFDWESQSAGGGELRVYRYKKGWESLSDSALTADAADIFNILLEEVTDTDKKAVYEQYQLDFVDWPVHRGAPFADMDNNGTYDPENGDYPGLHEADQVIWMIFNDLSNRTQDFGGSPPIGLEHRITAWAYENRDGFGETIFERHQLKSHAGGTIDSMYIASWVDSDLGNYTDDYVGCDSVINLAYAYNSSWADEDFDAYEIPPGAVGYQLLSGPVIYDEEMKKISDLDLGMMTFGYFINDSSATWDDPDEGNYSGTRQWYNALRGYIPTDSDEPEQAWLDHNGNPTHYPLSGDPVTGEGDIENKRWEASDRRFYSATGPFSLEPGQTAEIILAITGTVSTNYLSSITKLKYISKKLQENWDAPLPEPRKTDGYTGPTKFELKPNYPNPFNGSTRIQFYIEEQSRTLLDVFNIAGERVEILFDEQAQGLQEITWQPRDQPSGTYIIRLQAHGLESYIKAVYIK